MLSITNVTVLTPTEKLEQANVFITNGSIDHIEIQQPSQRVSAAQQATTIDATGLILAPGFIDLQLNGGFGKDFTKAPDTIWDVGSQLTRYGVTSFLPTIITSPLQVVAEAQHVLENQRPPNYAGAIPLGLHVEGPFLNPQKKGAHNGAYLRQPNLSAIADWTIEQQVRLVTIAPELTGAIPVISVLRERGIVVSAGHSMATLAEANAGLEAGISYGTHLFNAMPQLHHREPGLIGALLADDALIIGLIADGQHVHPDLIELIWRTVGSERINLVTDAMSALGMSPGTYPLGDQQVTVSHEIAKLPDGTLAGSILSCDAALRNIIQYTACSIGEALLTMTQTPAKLLKLGQHKGRIQAGYDADLVLLTPDLEVVLTVVNGQVVYQNPEHKIGSDHESPR